MRCIHTNGCPPRDKITRAHRRRWGLQRLTMFERTAGEPHPAGWRNRGAGVHSEGPTRHQARCA